MKPLSILDHCAAHGSRIVRDFNPGLGLTLFLLCAGTAVAEVGATLTPDTTTSVATSPVVLQVTGLATGGSVMVERFVDANANGTVDAGEVLAERFGVTDGQVTSIGGVRNPHIPGDEDGAADGRIRTNLTPALGPELGRFAGQQIIRVSSPAAEFAPFTRALTITQPAEAQSITVTVTDGVDPVPYASVFLLDATTDGEFVLGVIANASGQCTVNAPVGSYQIAAFKTGCVADFSVPPVLLPTGAVLTQGIQVAAATTSVSGKAADASTGEGLGGVQLFVGTQDGHAAIISTNADGTYVAPVTAGLWSFETSEISLGHFGYLSLNKDTAGITADTTSAAATGVDIQVPKASALIHGTVTDSSAAPLAGIRMGADDNTHTYNCKAITDANGHYVLAVRTGLWQTYISSDNQGLAGYIIPNGQAVEITGAQAVLANFSMLAVDAHLQGVVIHAGVPVPGIRVGAFNSGSHQFITVPTAADGTFDLGLFAGTWTLRIESLSAASFNIVSPAVDYTLGAHETLGGITLAVNTASAWIDGNVSDSNSQPVSANVYANATIGGVFYIVDAQTDGTGHYVMPVIDGTWQVGAFANDYVNSVPQTVLISGTNATCNITLIKAPGITTQPVNQSVVIGQNASFTVVASGMPVPTFQWQVSTDGGSVWNDLANDSTYSGVTEAMLNVASHIGLNGYRYRCIATNTGGSATSNAATLTVNMAFAPNITSQPPNWTVTAGQNATFAVAAGGAPAPTFQWQVSTDNGGNWSNLGNDSIYSGVDTPSMTVHATLIAQSGYRYRATATNSEGTATSNAAVLTVNATAAVSATLTPSTISSADTTPVVLQVTGLDTGGSVIVERFVDADANGVVDEGEFFAERFEDTSGQVTSIGGVRNSNIPGDEDGAADGQIRTFLIPATGPELGRFAGQQIIRVSSPTAAFATLTRTLTITQPAQAQSISGTVTDGTLAVPYAGVFILDATTDGEFVSGVVADASGRYTLAAPAGSYQIAAFKVGYVADFSMPPVTLAAGVPLPQDIQLVAATRTISGKVADAGTGAGLGGVQLFVGNQDGEVAIIGTNGDGTYAVPVTAGQWSLDLSEISLRHLGYLSYSNQSWSVTADTTSGNATGVNINVSKVTALIHGTVADASANPLAGIRMGADDNSHTYNCNATTDANGHYVLGVATGLWQAYISNDSPGLAGYVVPNGKSVALSGAQAVLADFSMLAVNAHLQGVVSNAGTPVSGIRIGAFNQAAGQSIMALTDINGFFDLGVFAGTWSVQIESSDAASFNIVSPWVSYTLNADQTISGIVFAVKSSTAQITGNVKDFISNLPLSANVNASATIGGVSYTVNTRTDTSGDYVLRVIDGTWYINVNANGYTSPNQRSRTLPGSNTTSNYALNKTPVITQPAGRSVTAGQIAAFSINANSNGPVTFLWQVSTDGGSNWTNLANNATYSGVTTTGLNVLSHIGLNGYRYRCVATNAFGSVTSNGALLTVTAPPSFTGHPANRTVTAGQDATFTVAAGGFPAPAIQWQWAASSSSEWGDLGNDSTYSGVNTATLTVSATSIGQNGYCYRAVATSTAGTATSNWAMLTVNVFEALHVTSPAVLPNGMIGAYYTTQLQAAGGLTPHTWAVVAGGDTGALTLHPATGVIDGTPNTTGTLHFTVRVTDASSATAIQDVTILIGAVQPSAKWSMALHGGPIYYSSPAVGSDGTIYVGSGAPFSFTDTRGLYAVNPNGSLKWQYTSAEMPNMFTPSVAADGTVYVQDAYSSLYAFTPAGVLKWKYPFNISLAVGQTAPAIAADGTIYVGADTLYAIHPDGTLKWRCNHNSMGYSIIRSSPAIAADGTVYVGINGFFGVPGVNFGNALMALNPDGSFKWEYILQGTSWVFSSPAIGADGTIFIGAETGGDLDYVYAVNSNGALKWRYNCPGGRTIRSSPAVGVDGTVYIGTKSFYDEIHPLESVNADFLALNPDGTLKWKYPIDQAGADIYGSPTLGADGMIYFGAETGFLYALNPDGSLAWRYGTNNGINWTSPAIDRNGTLYIGNNDGNLFAIPVSSMGLAASSWPKFRHDNSNKGAVATAQENWRMLHFGDSADDGDGRNSNDYDHDGIVNLVEFAFGLDPKQNSAGQLPQPQRIDDRLAIGFTQPDGVTGIHYGAEWSTTLQAGDWHPVADTGTGNQHVFSVPMGTHSSLFMRLVVTSP